MDVRWKLGLAAAGAIGVGVWWKTKQSKIGLCVEAADGGRKVCAGDVPVEQGWNPFRAVSDWFAAASSSSSSAPIGGGIVWGSQGPKPSEWFGDPPR